MRLASFSSSADSFVAKHCGTVCRLTPLPWDASHRRYARVEGGMFLPPMLLMDAPPQKEDMASYLRVATYLHGLGMRVPRIYAYDLSKGLALVENLGDSNVYTRCFARGMARMDLYRDALASLAFLHRQSHRDSNASFLPFYDEAAFAAEHGLLLEWYVRKEKTIPISSQAETRYYRLWRELLADIVDSYRQNWVVVLRDYHVDNLVFCPQERSARRCGLLDFQDALRGHRGYDLVSLLYDVRQTITADEVATLFKHYCQCFGETSVPQLADACAILNTQRLCKILGIFVRLDKRDGKTAYRAYRTRVRTLLVESLSHDAVAPLREWFSRQAILEGV